MFFYVRSHNIMLDLEASMIVKFVSRCLPKVTIVQMFHLFCVDLMNHREVCCW